MKISKIGFASVIALMAMITITSQTYAFWGGSNSGREMTQERFEEMKQLFLNNDYESFKEAMETRRESHKEDRKSSRESITREVNNIDNGVEMTLTSSDPEVVTKLQSKEVKESRNEEITKVQENITGGVKITITSDNEELVEKIQSKRYNTKSRSQRTQRRGGRGYKMSGQQNEDDDQNVRSGSSRRGSWNKRRWSLR